MKSLMRIADPNLVEVTLTVTMTVAAWKDLRKELSGNYPGWRLGQAIRELVDAVETKFYPPEPKDEKQNG